MTIFYLLIFCTVEIFRMSCLAGGMSKNHWHSWSKFQFPPFPVYCCWYWLSARVSENFEIFRQIKTLSYLLLWFDNFLLTHLLRSRYFENELPCRWYVKEPLAFLIKISISPVSGLLLLILTQRARFRKLWNFPPNQNIKLFTVVIWRFFTYSSFAQSRFWEWVALPVVCQRTTGILDGSK